MNVWTHEEAVSLCRKVEAVCPRFGCHVALTGGTLYKDGERKDVDILFYRIRQRRQIDIVDLMEALAEIGISEKSDHGWVRKATFNGKAIDIFFPEYPSEADYPIKETVLEDEIVF